MAADYTDEPSCTQKGTAWISFDAKPKTRKIVKKRKSNFRRIIEKSRTESSKQNAYRIK